MPQTAEMMSHLMRDLMMGMAERGGFYASVDDAANTFISMAIDGVEKLLPASYDAVCNAVQTFMSGGPGGKAVSTTSGTPFEGLISAKVTRNMLQAARFALLAEVCKTHGACGFCTKGTDGIPHAGMHLSSAKANASTSFLVSALRPAFRHFLGAGP